MVLQRWQPCYIGPGGSIPHAVRKKTLYNKFEIFPCVLQQSRKDALPRSWSDVRSNGWQRELIETMKIDE